MLLKRRFCIHAQIKRMERYHAWKVGFILSKTKSSGDYFGIGFDTGWIFSFWEDETFLNNFARKTKDSNKRRRNFLTDSNFKMNWTASRKNPNWKQISEFLKTDFSLETLASLCGMSETYFQRLFKEKYGISPKKYIIQLKVNHACDLLHSECYSITQVANLCGYEDVYYFSRQFKNYVGVTPSAFEQRYKSSK